MLNKSNKALEIQANYYNERQKKSLEFAVGDLVLLNTVNSILKNYKEKFKRKSIGPFRVVERVGKQSYKL